MATSVRQAVGRNDKAATRGARGTAPTGPRAIPLSTGHFHKVAGQGFGDGRNSYAYCYAWHNDHVYIGTNRDILVLIRKRFRFEVPLLVWPVEVPEKIDPLDLRAQIWRYSPAKAEWTRVYQSRMTKGLENREVPLAAGFRNMAVFQGKRDDVPAIYTIPSCGSQGIGPVLMRSIDGEQFEEISEPGMGLGDPNVTSFRAVLPFKGKLFVTPAGSRGANPNVSYHAMILCSDDPVSGRWEPASPRSFGDSSNVSIHEMCAWGDYLYAGTMNVRHGCQVWKTLAEGKPPYSWTKVFDSGADRGQLNQAIVSMSPFRGSLYVGTGVQNGGHDRINNIGPAAGEVIRVFPNDTWELVVGDARDTRFGLQAPVSGLGAGFDNPFAGYIWRICEHDGSLYVGTFDSSTFLRFARLDERAKRMLDGSSVDRFLRSRGGFDLWRTSDGEHWVPVTRNGFGNQYNFGVRALVSTPVGLFVGTANPFGPKVAVTGPAGIRYEDNPLGGVEVWHGSPHHAGVHDTEPPAWERRTEAVAIERMLSGAENSGGADAAVLDTIQTRVGSIGAFDDEDLLTSLTASALDQVGHPGPHGSEGPLVSSPATLESTHRRASAEKSMKAPPRARDTETVDEIDAYFGSDMRFIGLWTSEVDTPLLACLRLVDEAVGRLAPDADVRPATALIIGAGAGGVARRLLQLVPTVRVRAVVFDKQAKQRAHRVNPRLDLRVIKRSRLTKAFDEPFDAVLWIEGPTERETADGACLVRKLLRPGGRFVAVDLLSAGTGTVNVDRVAVYKARVLAAGFATCEVFDLTKSGWERFFAHSRDRFARSLQSLQIDRERYDAILRSLPGGLGAVAGYLLIVARNMPETTNG